MTQKTFDAPEISKLQMIARREFLRFAAASPLVATPPSLRSSPPLQARLEPVSADIRIGLCSRAGMSPGKSLARPETRAAFWATPADSRRQRPRGSASPAAKPRKVKDYSQRPRKPELRRTAWWGWQDSNRRASDYVRHQMSCFSEAHQCANPIICC
jgi:hypothetical protein